VGVKPKNRGGRPRTRQPKEGQRLTISVRVTPRLRTLLDESAQESGRSMSQEAEALLERTFEFRHSLRETLELAYGKHLSGLLLVIGDTVAKTAAAIQGVSIFATPKSERPGKYNFNRCLSDSWTYTEIAEAIEVLMRELRPPGSGEPPKAVRDAWASTKGIGREYAGDTLQLLNDPGEDRMQWAAENLADLLLLKEAAPFIGTSGAKRADDEGQE
jgi:hypothetical protein